MGGHNKWSQIKRQKGANDAANSKVWGKFSKRISVESRLAAGDINSPTLRTLIKSALATNMSKSAIDKAVAKGISNDAESYESITYETYGPAGVAILIDCLTDSRNRTAQEIKHLLSELGLSLAVPGSAMWAFVRNLDGSYSATTNIPVPEASFTELVRITKSIEEHSDVQAIFLNTTLTI
jgi:YebC/PmpR family DNA-binding regulatory protein